MRTEMLVATFTKEQRSQILAFYGWRYELWSYGISHRVLYASFPRVASVFRVTEFRVVGFWAAKSVDSFLKRNRADRLMYSPDLSVIRSCHAFFLGRGGGGGK